MGMWVDEGRKRLYEYECLNARAVQWVWIMECSICPFPLLAGIQSNHLSISVFILKPVTGHFAYPPPFALSVTMSIFLSLPMVISISILFHLSILSSFLQTHALSPFHSSSILSSPLTMNVPSYLQICRWSGIQIQTRFYLIQKWTRFIFVRFSQFTIVLFSAALHNIFPLDSSVSVIVYVPCSSFLQLFCSFCFSLCDFW